MIGRSPDGRSATRPPMDTWLSPRHQPGGSGNGGPGKVVDRLGHGDDGHDRARSQHHRPEAAWGMAASWCPGWGIDALGGGGILPRWACRVLLATENRRYGQPRAPGRSWATWSRLLILRSRVRTEVWHARPRLRPVADGAAGRCSSDRLPAARGGAAPLAGRWRRLHNGNQNLSRRTQGGASPVPWSPAR